MGAAGASELNERLAVAAVPALAGQDVSAVQIDRPAAGGSSRSVVLHGRAIRTPGDELPIVIKTSTEHGDGLGRETAALSVIRDHGLAGAVRLLGVIESPAALILEDLGDGPSPADLLLGDDPRAAERAVVDWASTVSALHTASRELVGDFRRRLAVSADLNPLGPWLARAADRLPAALEAHGVRASERALDELRSLSGQTDALSGPAGLVPGDACPDNALYRDGVLTLIDFESAAFRPAAWDAAYLSAPWPTCWCAWSLPDHVRDAGLVAWNAAASADAQLAPEQVSRATILWTMLTLAPRLEWIANGSDRYADTEGTDPARRRPATKNVLLHRLRTAASAEDAGLPALSELAARADQALRRTWGDRILAVAPAFRDAGPRDWSG